MTIASRRLARRCRQRFATEPTTLPTTMTTTTEPSQSDTRATVENAEVTPVSPQENVDAAK